MEQKIIKPNFPDNFKYLVLDISDSFEQNIIQFLPHTKAFIDEAIQSQVACQTTCVKTEEGSYYRKCVLA